MNKIEYLKQALQTDLAINLAWVYSAFCTVKEGPEDYLKDPYPFRILNTHPKYQFISKSSTDVGKVELVDLDDSSTKEPLFKFKDRVKVDPTWAPNITGAIETGIGNLIFNAVVVVPHFGSRFPFFAEKISIKEIEKIIASRLTDTLPPGTERDPKLIYVDEYLRFRDSLVYMESFASIVSWSATRKGITAPTGLAPFKKKLLEKYGDTLKDPAVFAEYEGELKAFDREYLKDDPAYGTFISGKVLNVSRKKIFLSIGIPERLDTNDPIVPITRSLDDGQPTDPDQYAAVINGARFGSFSRGAETENGGVVSKSVIRIGNNFVIDDKDCGTPLGLRRKITAKNKDTFLGRALVKGEGTLFIEKIEQLDNLVGKTVVVRSPATCRAGPGDKICKTCSGVALSQYKEGLVIALLEVSHLILTQSLKAMHGKVLETAEVDLDAVMS